MDLTNLANPANPLSPFNPANPLNPVNDYEKNKTKETTGTTITDQYIRDSSKLEYAEFSLILVILTAAFFLIYLKVEL